ncbi:hypothetical protein HUA74_07835 [Myxococcus sp. CA051A]|uniref:hypothetical protein n=1 Tax=unclassified Myxococcus TaxID=2648731 RepID=UPI00157A9D83|nr:MULTISPECIES: hypothetical protein [unclassified Myxococcus]NTX11296.1 hypothetical protein [Myxococcus sp. CA056]NTX34604.1 hypothetical protein [Myxococcus sp. CA033]NTX60568.1 hypothetical protein [Myxococcus sp. CA051A]
MRLNLRALLASCAVAASACGGGETPPSVEPEPHAEDPCAPNGHIHREAEGDWCHCNKGHVAAPQGLACEVDPDYVPSEGFDFGDDGEHACWHVAHGPYVTVTATTSRNPRVDDFHTHYTVKLREENGQYTGTFSYKAFASGDFVVYLSTPDVPVSLVETAIQTQLTPAGTKSTGDFCSGLRHMVGYELTDRVQYTLTLGPTSLPEVGMVIEHLE